LHHEVVQERNSLRTPFIWHPVGVAVTPAPSTGGLRFATTTGYFLRTLRVVARTWKSKKPSLGSSWIARWKCFSASPHYFGADKRIRIVLFSTNLILTPGLVVTAKAVDSQLTDYVLPVEYVGSLPAFMGSAQVVVKLPDGIVNAGDLQVSITVRGRTSNSVLVGVTPWNVRDASLKIRTRSAATSQKRNCRRTQP